MPSVVSDVLIEIGMHLQLDTKHSSNVSGISISISKQGGIPNHSGI